MFWPSAIGRAQRDKEKEKTEQPHHGTSGTTSSFFSSQVCQSHFDVRSKMSLTDGALAKHVVPQILWGNGVSLIRKEKSWAVTTYHSDTMTNSSLRITAGNKIYSLTASKFGEFDSSKKVSTNDLGLYKKYRYVNSLFSF